MNGRMRWLSGVIAVVAAAFCGTAAADEKPGKAAVADRPVEPYAGDEIELIGTPSQGCCASPRLVPVCRCVPTSKKKPKTEYDVKCELVCVPGCSSHLCGKRFKGCADGCSDGCCDATPCDHATIRPKKTLLKKVVDEEENAWEYEVEWVCATCATGCCSPGGCEDGSHVLTAHGRSRSRFHGLWHGLLNWK